MYLAKSFLNIEQDDQTLLDREIFIKMIGDLLPDFFADKQLFKQDNISLYYFDEYAMGTCVTDKSPSTLYLEINQPKNIKDKIIEAEKPVELIEEIIEYISKPYETLLDQFAGSGNFVIACNNKNRNSIAIEKDDSMFNKMKDNIEKNLNVEFEEIDYEY